MFYILLISSTLMLIDVLYSLYYFQYTYLLELKKRFAHMANGLLAAYKEELILKINKEIGDLRRFMQIFLLIWIVACFINNLWFLPTTIFTFDFIINIIFRKPYISPILIFTKLTIMVWVLIYSILTLF